MLPAALLAAGFRESTHFQLWTYIIATPLGGVLLFVGYLLLSWAWQTDQGRSIWLMVAGLVGIIGLRLWSGDFTYGFVGSIAMLVKVAPEVRHLDTGRWGRNFMIVGILAYFIGFLNTPLALPRDVTDTEMFALQAVESMGRRAKKEERRQRAREAADRGVAVSSEDDDRDEEEEKPKPSLVPVAAAKPAATAAALAPPAPVPTPTPLVLRTAADVLREGLALKARERRLLERKSTLNAQDREAVQWLTEDIQRYNLDQQRFHQLAVAIDPNYASKLAAANRPTTPTPTPRRK